MQIIDLQSFTGTFSTAEKSLIINALEAGSVIIYPTDTLYGFGADVISSNAVNTLYQLKQREDAPVSVLTESVASLLEMAKGLDSDAIALIQRFLPGPMTVICHTDYPFEQRLFSKRETIGFRVPGDKVSRMIPRLLGRPITTTSVNPAGEKPAGSVDEVRNYFGDAIPLMLDMGTIPPSKGSTVIDLTTQPFNILREGEISRLELQDFLN